MLYRLPSLTITIAKNQKKITKQTANLNITEELSIAKTKNQKQLTEAVSNLIYAPKKLQQLSKNSFKTCDGLGTKKVVNFLEATFKKVEISDSKKLLSWRNKKFIRESSLNKKRIHKKNHEIWMEKTQYPKKGNWLIGYGVSAAARAAPFNETHAKVLLNLTNDTVTATLQMDATDIGTGSYTILAQTVSDCFNVPLEQVREFS